MTVPRPRRPEWFDTLALVSVAAAVTWPPPVLGQEGSARPLKAGPFRARYAGPMNRASLSCGHTITVGEAAAAAIAKSAEVSLRDTGRAVPTLRCPRCGKVGTVNPEDRPPPRSPLVQAMTAPPRRPGVAPPRK